MGVIMDRQEVEMALIGNGYQKRGSPEPSENGSMYQEFIKPNAPLVWLGDYYIENEHILHAFAYKDPLETKESLERFINDSTN